MPDNITKVEIVGAASIARPKHSVDDPDLLTLLEQIAPQRVPSLAERLGEDPELTSGEAKKEFFENERYGGLVWEPVQEIAPGIIDLERDGGFGEYLTVRLEKDPEDVKRRLGLQDKG